jgi:glycosyltransferase involved in cell wall biosynthesis
MPENCKVSIVMATYNGEKYLAEQLESILSQTECPIEIIIRDDGSTDTTVQIVESYRKRFPEVIRYLGQNSDARNRGFVSNFLTALREVSDFSSLIFFSDQDDLWKERKIQEMYESASSILVQGSPPGAVFGMLEVTDKYGIVVSVSPEHCDLSFSRALAENIITGCAMAINQNMRRALVSPSWDCSKIIAHDWLVYLIASANNNLVFLRKPVVLYRQHEANVEGAAVGMKSAFFRRLNSFVTGRTTKKNPLPMLEHFYSVYHDRLTGAQRDLLEDYLYFKGGSLSALTLVLRRKVRRKGFLNHTLLILRTLFRTLR